MELPTELLFLILYNVPLSSVKNMALINKQFSKVIENMDWSEYLKYNN